MVARCIAALAAADIVRTMHFVLDVLLGMLVNIENVIQRQGAIEAVERVVDKLQLCIVPYTVLLVVPLLGKCLFLFIFCFIMCFVNYTTFQVA